MKKYFLVVALAAVTCTAFGQNVPPEGHPQRTPEEIARKQNAMIIRELGLKDSAQIDTLYRMHLKFAKLRAISNTRAEDVERLQAMTQELKGILTPEQYHQFMDRQVGDGPRNPHAQLKHFPQWRECDSVPPSPPGEGPDKPDRP